MKTTAWKNVAHKNSPNKRAEIKREALAEYDRVGFAALRKAREQTQVELAEKLGINQASVSAIETSTDLLLSTLTKYVRALGGEIEIRAVFPEAAFNLQTAFLPSGDSQINKAPQRRLSMSQSPNRSRRVKAATA